ncbi:MAG: hypothetical protein ACTFAK_11250 [Candidatus Electronema sp. VV]
MKKFFKDLFCYLKDFPSDPEFVQFLILFVIQYVSWELCVYLSGMTPVEHFQKIWPHIMNIYDRL